VEFSEKGQNVLGISWVTLKRRDLKTLQLACRTHHHVKLVPSHPAAEYAQTPLHIKPAIAR